MPCNSFRIETTKSVLYDCGLTGFTKNQNHMTLICNDCGGSVSSTEYGFKEDDIRNLARDHALGIQFTTDMDGNEFDEPMTRPNTVHGHPVSARTKVAKYSMTAREAAERFKNHLR